MDPSTRFDLDQQLRAAQPPPPSSLPILPTTPATPLTPVHHWSDTYLSLPLHSTFIFLHSTILITLTLSPSTPPPLPPPSLTFYHPSPHSPLDVTSTTSLGHTDSFSTSLSSRLSRSFQRHFLCMVEVGDGLGETRGVGEEQVERWVERRIIQELKHCKDQHMFR